MNTGETEVAMIGIMIPIIAIIGGIILAGFALRHRAQRNEMEHRERLLAIEKGAALPQATLPPPPRERNPYIWGFILLAIGLALVIGGILDHERDLGGEMAVMFVGLAILLANWLFVRDRKRKEKKAVELASAASAFNGTSSELR